MLVEKTSKTTHAPVIRRAEADFVTEVLVALETGFGGTTMASVVTARGSGAPLVKSSKLPADLMLAFFADDFAGFKTFVGSSITVLAFCSG